MKLFVQQKNIPRCFAPPLSIEGNQAHAAQVPSMKRSARQGGACKVSAQKVYDGPYQA